MSTGTNNIMSLVDDFDKRDGTDYGDGLDNTNQIEDNEPDGEEGDESSQNEDSSDNRDAESTNDDDNQPDDGGDNQPVDKNKQEQQTKLQMLHNGLAQDEKGNLVDPNTGQIIARAGSERRLFEKSSRLQTVLKNKDDEIVKLKKDLADTRFLNDVPRQYGITNDEVAQAFELTVAFKRDPAAAARKVLEMALAAGYNVSQIVGEGASDAVEMGAVKRMLDERLAPLTDLQKQQQETQRERERMTRAQDEMNAWIESRPYADVHLRAIDKLVGENPNLSPDAAYYELRNFAERNGFDFRKPLGPQMAAKRQREQQNPDRQPPRSSSSLPNGRRPAGVRTMSDTEQADPSMSWDDLVRSTMR